MKSYGTLMYILRSPTWPVLISDQMVACPSGPVAAAAAAVSLPRLHTTSSGGWSAKSRRGVWCSHLRLWPTALPPSRPCTRNASAGLYLCNDARLLLVGETLAKPGIFYVFASFFCWARFLSQVILSLFPRLRFFLQLQKSSSLSCDCGLDPGG